MVLYSIRCSNGMKEYIFFHGNSNENVSLLDWPRSSPSERPDRLVITRKRPTHNFSSSDDSDVECSPSVDIEKTASNPCNSEISHNLSDCDSSDIECCYIEQAFTQKIYATSERKYVDNEDMLGTDVLKKSCDFLEKESKASKSKRKVMCEETREKLLKEKEEKKLEKAREKALKKATSEAQKANRPGECIKNIQALLDQKLLTEEYGGDILLALQAAQMQYNIQDQLSEKTITWVKSVHDYHCDDNMKIIVRKNLKEENLVLVVMTSNELVELIRSSSLRRHMQNIALQHVNKRLILVIYKLEEYHRLQNLEKQRKFKAQCRTGIGENLRVTSCQVSRSDIETALIEIQVFEECSHRFVDTAQDLGLLVAQFTKALAEKVFKLEKQQKEQEKLEWFASGDSRDTVKVDKNGNGLTRLWKQQLCQFNNASIDTAEAIVSLYSSPKSLIQAYEKCSTQKEGQQLLQDIAVRRAAGPLTSVRRIGPELSKKIYNFFTAKSGDLSLSQD